MALTTCPECGHQVSDTASSCPSCGAPLGAARREAQAAGTQITTTQDTAKRFKLQQLLSLGAIVLGFIIGISSMDNPESSAPAIGGLFILGGFVWYVVTRVRIWWHHA